MSSKLSFIASGAVLFALAIGTLLPIQAAANAQLGRLIGHPLWAACLSLFVSFSIMLPVIALSKVPLPNISSALSGPWWLWVGGLIGAAYVTAATLLVPRIGAAGFMIAIVTGQMLMAVIIDHYGLLGLSSRAVNLERLAGIVLLVIAMVLIQHSSVRE